jgi:RNA polymerase sigma-70 factor, ECF subfamily
VVDLHWKIQGDRCASSARPPEGLEPEIASRVDEVADENAARAATEIEDDRLRLIFTFSHPAIDPNLQVPLTLREVCGLTTEEIARAFLTSKATMAQRIVRGKAKIRGAQIPYDVRSLGDLPDRLDAVLSAIYIGVQRRICGLAGRFADTD